MDKQIEITIYEFPQKRPKLHAHICFYNTYYRRWYDGRFNGEEFCRAFKGQIDYMNESSISHWFYLPSNER